MTTLSEYGNTPLVRIYLSKIDAIIDEASQLGAEDLRAVVFALHTTAGAILSKMLQDVALEVKK